MSSRRTSPWTRTCVATLSVLLLLCFLVLAVPTAQAGAPRIGYFPTDSPALSSVGQVIYADLDLQVCPTTAWYFKIWPFDTQSDAPVSLYVTWANGRSEVVPLLQFDADQGIADYATTHYLASTVTSASAVIHSGWRGQFYLLAPCSMPVVTATRTATPTSTKTQTRTATPTGIRTRTPTRTSTPTATRTLQPLSASCLSLTSDVPSRIVAPSQALSFRGTAISGSGSTAIVAYSFNFGDGSGTGRIPIGSWPGWKGATHAYSKAGNYQVEFLVEQANGIVYGGVNSRCAFRLDVKPATARP